MDEELPNEGYIYTTRDYDSTDILATLRLAPAKGRLSLCDRHHLPCTRIENI